MVDSSAGLWLEDGSEGKYISSLSQRMDGLDGWTNLKEPLEIACAMSAIFPLCESYGDLVDVESWSRDTSRSASNAKTRGRVDHVMHPINVIAGGMKLQSKNN
jgi:hypothetical protein